MPLEKSQLLEEPDGHFRRKTDHEKGHSQATETGRDAVLDAGRERGRVRAVPEGGLLEGGELRQARH